MLQIVLTNHVIKRAKERDISLKDLDKAVRFPDKIVQSKTKSSRKHIKDFGFYRITVVIKRQGNKWITVSTWKKTQSSVNQQKWDKSTYKPFFLEKLINDFLLKLEKTFKRRS